MSSSTRNTHWCYRCRCSVRPGGPDMVCPNCHAGFVHQLDDMEFIMNPHDFLGLRTENGRGPRNGIMEVISALTGHRTAGRNREADAHGSPDDIPDRGSGFGLGPWLLFHGQPPIHVPENGGPERANITDYFVGPGLEDLIEQLAQNDRRGPAPALPSSIDAMPTVKITQKHLRIESYCPVCQERFELGSKAREMPCKHLYHSDCIVPWLVQHNSCPVCRHELQPQSSSRGRSARPSGQGSSGVGGSHARQNLFSKFSFRWPFRSSNSDSSS